MSLEPLAGLSVVDLYAGCGALGIEALSRGAASVDFVESDRQARDVLMANLDALDLRRASTVWPLDLPRGLRRIADRVAAAELILADPPYGGREASQVLAALGAMPLAAGARVVVERHAKDVTPDCAGMLRRLRERRYGETVIDVYEVRSAADGPASAQAKES